jgi:outer membrane protein assembly factor BamA
VQSTAKNKKFKIIRFIFFLITCLSLPLFAAANTHLYDSGKINSMASKDEEHIAEADSIPSKIEPLPILSYDSNTGFGFGAKSFFLNLFKARESFDVILFLSTKGQRWFRLVFSIPDFELRQGKVYPLSLDLLTDYDKVISYSYFGIGNESRFEDEEFYLREMTEVSASFSRGFSDVLVGQFALKYGRIESRNFDPAGQLIHLIDKNNQPLIDYISLYLNLRYDGRDSYIHPTSGLVFQSEIEYAPGNIQFVRWSQWFQYYTLFLFPETILAFRLGLASISGDQLPLQMMIPLGGNRTLRGYTLGRFIDNTAALSNLEFRIPIFGRLGGLLGLDTGRVWRSTRYLSLDNWQSNVAAGFRYYFDTYIVRVDFGLSDEILGIYFNFNHIF